MILKMKGERLAVKRLSDGRIGTILTPDSMNKSSFIGEVINAGPDCVDTKTGDKILFARYSAYEIPIDAAHMIDIKVYKDVVVMNESDVLGGLIDD